MHCDGLVELQHLKIELTGDAAVLAAALHVANVVWQPMRVVSDASVSGRAPVMQVNAAVEHARHAALCARLSSSAAGAAMARPVRSEMMAMLSFMVQIVESC